MAVTNLRQNIGNWQERVDLAATFRWTARLNLHEGVAKDAKRMKWRQSEIAKQQAAGQAQKQEP